MLREFVEKMPKAELHLHIEGTFEPELMFKIAQRNNVQIKYDSVEEIRRAYNFGNLQDFLDIYYAGASVLLNEEDFYDLTWAYLEKAAAQNVLHAEIMFDPQTHTERGVKFSDVITGISKAMNDAREKLGISSLLILSFLRHLSEKDAFATLEEAAEYKDLITAVGLDSSELGNPPSKFKNVFAEARKMGFRLTAHAGEEGPAEYVREALDVLKVERIDHGNHSLDDENLTKRIAEEKIPLTVCPLSNLQLKVVKDLKEHPLKKMLNENLKATVNSDDPAYFGGYVNENFVQVAQALDLTKEDIYTLAKNSFEASFLEESAKKDFVRKLDEYFAEAQ